MPKGIYDHFKIRGKKKTKEHIRKISETHLRLYRLGNTKMGYQKGSSNIACLPEIRKKISYAIRGTKHPWTSERNRLQHLTGPKNPMWKGGIARLPYTNEFNKKLKEIIKERDQYCCQFCLERKEPSKLYIHHIDYDKSNNSGENLISLCKRCHSKTNSKREYWSKNMKGLLLCNSLNL